MPRKSLLAVMLVAIAYNGRELVQRKQTIGLGLTPGVDSAATFFTANHLQGPLLNNLNISGYLIHYLFPQQRVYVDSRPEAYSAAFLQDQYQAFLARRKADPAWVTVFADNTGTILVRR